MYFVRCLWFAHCTGLAPHCVLAWCGSLSLECIPGVIVMPLHFRQSGVNMQIMSNVIVECQIISGTLFFIRFMRTWWQLLCVWGMLQQVDHSPWEFASSIFLLSFSASLAPGFYFILHTCQSQTGSLRFKTFLFYFYCKMIYFLKHAVRDKHGWDRQFICLFERRMVFIVPVKL